MSKFETANNRGIENSYSEDARRVYNFIPGEPGDEKLLKLTADLQSKQAPVHVPELTLVDKDAAAPDEKKDAPLVEEAKESKAEKAATPVVEKVAENANEKVAEKTNEKSDEKVAENAAEKTDPIIGVEHVEILPNGDGRGQWADGAAFTEHTNNVGARLRTNTEGQVERVTRRDGTVVSAAYEDGKPIGMAETKDGNTTYWRPDYSKRSEDGSLPWVSKETDEVRHDMALSSNGNLNFEANGEKHIVRGNGAELIEAKGRASFDFDAEGRIDAIHYPDGSTTFGFKYKGDSEQIDAVITHNDQTNKTTTSKPDNTWGEPQLADDGTYTQYGYQFDATMSEKIFRGKQTFGTDGKFVVNTLQYDHSVALSDGYGNITGSRAADSSDFVDPQPESARRALEAEKFKESALGTGAKIGVNANGDLKVIRTDDSSVVQTKIDGKPAIVEQNGDSERTWTIKEGTAGTAEQTWISNPPGEERQNMQLEKNGNLTYKQNGEKHILRSNGAELVEGPGRATFNFDESGRISWVNYPDKSNSFGFKYAGATEKIDTVYCHKRETKTTVIHKPNGAWGNPKIAADGTYSQEGYQELGGQIFTGKQVFGTDGKDEISTLLADGRVSVKDGYGKEIGQRDATAADYAGRASNNIDPETRQADFAEAARLIDEQASGNPEHTDGSRRQDAALRLHESTDTSFHLKSYLLPSPDQLGAGSCLYMSATGIAEFLVNKEAGITNPKVGGPTDLSEQWTIALSQRVPLKNNYTDAVELLKHGGVVKDSRLPFRAYANSSWMSEQHPSVGAGDIARLPDMEKHVLFDTGAEGSQLRNHVMNQEHVNRIKNFLRDKESPVLFVYKPEGTNWWHANVITGYDDKRQTFTVRDSSFGAKVENQAPYNYDGRSPWGAQKYRGEVEMSYSQAMQWGNHATGYTLLANGDGVVRTSNRSR